MWDCCTCPNTRLYPRRHYIHITDDYWSEISSWEYQKSPHNTVRMSSAMCDFVHPVKHYNNPINTEGANCNCFIQLKIMCIHMCMCIIYWSNIYEAYIDRKLLTTMSTASQVKFCRPQNISGASCWHSVDKNLFFFSYFIFLNLFRFPSMRHSMWFHDLICLGDSSQRFIGLLELNLINTHQSRATNSTYGDKLHCMMSAEVISHSLFRHSRSYEPCCSSWRGEGGQRWTTERQWSLSSIQWWTDIITPSANKLQ